MSNESNMQREREKERDHHNGGVTACRRACTAYMKGKMEGLKGDALCLIWLKGGLWRGGVGGGLRPEINESPELKHVAHA